MYTYEKCIRDQELSHYFQFSLFSLKNGGMSGVRADGGMMAVLYGGDRGHVCARRPGERLFVGRSGGQGRVIAHPEIALYRPPRYRTSSDSICPTSPEKRFLCWHTYPMIASSAPWSSPPSLTALSSAWQMRASGRRRRYKGSGVCGQVQTYNDNPYAICDAPGALPKDATTQQCCRHTA